MRLSCSSCVYTLSTKQPVTTPTYSSYGPLSPNIAYCVPSAPADFANVVVVPLMRTNSSTSKNRTRGLCANETNQRRLMSSKREDSKGGCVCKLSPLAPTRFLCILPSPTRTHTREKSSLSFALTQKHVSGARWEPSVQKCTG